jgi:hypothetical protein
VEIHTNQGRFVIELYPDDAEAAYQLGEVVYHSGYVVGSPPADARPSFWLDDVRGVDLLHVKLPRGAGPACVLNDVFGYKVGARVWGDSPT